MTYKDFIIPIAWSGANVVTAGGFYDRFLSILKFHKNGFYKVGHAAFLLVNGENGNIDYCDFGRYIAPKKYGRIRDKETDPEVAFDVKAKIDNGKIVNFNEIIKAISIHPYTRGSGTVFAGIQNKISREKAIEFIKKKQSRPYMPYGPFVFDGSNCARFVAQTIAFSKKGNGLRFLYPLYLTPSPVGNIFNTSYQTIYRLEASGEVTAHEIIGRIRKLRFIIKLIKYKSEEKTPDLKTLISSKLNPKIVRKFASENSQWLGGIGAGAWYEITNLCGDKIEVTRTQDDGNIDFCYKFSGPVEQIDFNSQYNFEYGSQGNRILISQNGITYKFLKVESV